MRSFCLSLVLAATAIAQDAVLVEASVAVTGEGAPHGVGIIDVNQDGRPDVVIDQTRPAGINIFLNDGKGGIKGDFNAMLGTRMGPNFGMGANADGDAFPDFVQMDSNSGKLTVYKGTKGKLSDGQETDLNVGWPISAVFKDMNGDLRPDLVVCGWPDPVVDKTPGRIKIMLGPGYKESWSLDVPDCGATVAGDVNGDKRLDVITTDQKKGIITVFPGDGRGMCARQPIRSILDVPEAGLSPNGIAVIDLDGDKILDLAVACEGNTFVRLMKGDGKGSFTKLADIAATTGASNTAPTAKFPKFVCHGDFNGDKKLDLAIGACAIEMGAQWTITIHLGDGTGAFTKNCEFKGLGNFKFYSACVGDFNLDKKDDLIVAITNEDEVSGTVRRWLSKK